MNSCNESSPIMQREVERESSVSRSGESVEHDDCFSPGGQRRPDGDRWIPTADDRCSTCICQV